MSDSNVIDFNNSNDYLPLEEGEYSEEKRKKETNENDKDSVEQLNPLYYLKMIAMTRNFTWKNIYV